jgi:hypothetical protein
MTDTLDVAEENDMLNHPDALAALAQAAFARAKRQALAELDRHSVASHGTDDKGRIVVRPPTAAKAAADPS